jgi:hypothetical protein
LYGNGNDGGALRLN